MMRFQKRGNPAGGPGFGGMQSNEGGLRSQYSTPTLHNASARTVERELSILLMAAHRVAGGYGLAWSDYERVHDAHQHVVRVLAAVRGKEVLT